MGNLLATTTARPPAFDVTTSVWWPQNMLLTLFSLHLALEGTLLGSYVEDGGKARVTVKDGRNVVYASAAVIVGRNDGL